MGRSFVKAFKRVAQSFAGLPRFCGAVGIDGHVDPQPADAESTEPLPTRRSYCHPHR